MEYSILVYLGIGSNVGHKFNNIATALELLGTSEGCKVSKVSPIYETKPYGVEDQDSFLNAAVELETTLEPYDLLKLLQTIESKTGRKQTFRWGPREIDIDILLYEDKIVNDGFLSIPHKDMLNRDFVVFPLLDIAPEIIYPITGELISKIVLTKELTSNNCYRMEKISKKELD